MSLPTGGTGTSEFHCQEQQSELGSCRGRYNRHTLKWMCKCNPQIIFTGNVQIDDIRFQYFRSCLPRSIALPRENTLCYTSTFYRRVSRLLLLICRAILVLLLLLHIIPVRVVLRLGTAVIIILWVPFRHWNWKAELCLGRFTDLPFWPCFWSWRWFWSSAVGVVRCLVCTLGWKEPI